MEILNIGSGEFLIIILLALLVFKPSDIYSLMRTMGKYASRLRRAWREFVVNIEKEIPDDVMDEVDNVRQLGKETQETVQETLQESKILIDDSVSDIKQGTDAARKDLSESAGSADDALKESLRSGIAAAQQAGGDDEQ